MYKCEVCGKTSNHGNKVSITRSHVSKRVKQKQKPNIQRKKVVVNGTPKHIYICTRCIRTDKKKHNLF